MDLKLIDNKDFNKLRADIKNLAKVNKELQEVWLNSNEAADFLKLSKRTLIRYREKGKIPFSKDGRKIWYRKSDLISYLGNNYCSVELLNKRGL